MKNYLSLPFIVLISLIMLLAPVRVNAQESLPAKKHNFWQRVSIGGNIGLQFGSITAINISPEIMVRAVDQLYLGTGFTYEYIQYNNYYLDRDTQEYIDFKSNVYGGRIFARYYLRSLLDNFLGNLFAHVEYEYLYYTYPLTPDINGSIIDLYSYRTYRHGTDAMQVNSLFIGAGYDQPLGGRVSLSFLILYNLNESYNSPYTNPLFRLGVGVGL
jgi:hypothetical protein